MRQAIDITGVVQQIATSAGDMLDPAGFPLLSEFCKVCVSLRVIGNEVRRFKPEWATSEEGLRRWDCLLRMQDRLQARLSSLATKLRISPQTRVHKNHASVLFDNHVDPDRETPWNFCGEASD